LLSALLRFGPFITAARCSLLATAAMIVSAALSFKKRRKSEKENV